MKKKPTTQPQEKEQDHLPAEIYVYTDKARQRYGGTVKVLSIGKDLNALGTSRGRDVGVYQLTKVVQAVKKTVVTTQVNEKK